MLLLRALLATLFLVAFKPVLADPIKVIVSRVLDESNIENLPMSRDDYVGWLTKIVNIASTMYTPEQIIEVIGRAVVVKPSIWGGGGQQLTPENLERYCKAYEEAMTNLSEVSSDDYAEFIQSTKSYIGRRKPVEEMDASQAAIRFTYHDYRYWPYLAMGMLTTLVLGVSFVAVESQAKGGSFDGARATIHDDSFVSLCRMLYTEYPGKGHSVYAAGPEVKFNGVLKAVAINSIWAVWFSLNSIMKVFLDIGSTVIPERIVNKNKQKLFDSGVEEMVRENDGKCLDRWSEAGTERVIRKIIDDDKSLKVSRRILNDKDFKGMVDGIVFLEGKKAGEFNRLCDNNERMRKVQSDESVNPKPMSMNLWTLFRRRNESGLSTQWAGAIVGTVLTISFGVCYIFIYPKIMLLSGDTNATLIVNVSQAAEGCQGFLNETFYKILDDLPSYQDKPVEGLTFYRVRCNSEYCDLLDRWGGKLENSSDWRGNDSNKMLDLRSYVCSPSCSVNEIISLEEQINKILEMVGDDVDLMLQQFSILEQIDAFHDKTVDIFGKVFSLQEGSWHTLAESSEFIFFYIMPLTAVFGFQVGFHIFAMLNWAGCFRKSRCAETCQLIIDGCRRIAFRSESQVIQVDAEAGAVMTSAASTSKDDMSMSKQGGMELKGVESSSARGREGDELSVEAASRSASSGSLSSQKSQYSSGSEGRTKKKRRKFKSSKSSLEKSTGKSPERDEPKDAAASELLLDERGQEKQGDANEGELLYADEDRAESFR